MSENSLRDIYAICYHGKIRIASVIMLYEFYYALMLCIRLCYGTNNIL